MSGALTIVGLGPGDPRHMTPAATQAIEEATDVVGYGPYLDRIVFRADQTRHASDNRVELDRARLALTLAMNGRRVVVVSGGDPGVFAMAAAAFEAMEQGDPRWRRLPVRVEPGVSAMLAAAARIGAPLGGDFCVISLSDNLKPWNVITQRLAAALQADFAIALYNPISKARPERLGEALRLARDHRASETPVMFARAIGRADESVRILTAADAPAAAPQADMATLVLIGASTTRVIARDDLEPIVYTPRSYGTSP